MAFTVIQIHYWWTTIWNHSLSVRKLSIHYNELKIIQFCHRRKWSL